MGKFTVINTVGIIVLVLMWAAGYLTDILNSPALPGICVLTGVLVVGLILTAMKRFVGAHWVCRNLPMFGLAGTVLGLITLFSHIVFTGDVNTVLTSAASGLGLAFYSTLVGICGYLWLSFNMLHQDETNHG